MSFREYLNEQINEGNLLNLVPDDVSAEYEKTWKKSKLGAIMKLIKGTTGKDLKDIPDKAADKIDVIYQNADDSAVASSAIKILDILRKYKVL